MSEFTNNFKKQGGFQIIKNYWKSGVLFYALSQLLLTGKSKKSLELLRLGTQLKVKNKLYKRYIGTIREFDDKWDSTITDKNPTRIVWVCWLQGIENAPELIKKCYISLKRNIKDREIVLLSSNNLSNYIHFPEYIEEKYKKGIISNAHYADLIRVEILYKYGGTWIDSTVFCSGSNIPKYMMDSPFFVFQNLKPGSNGAVDNTSNWFISSYSHHKFIALLRVLLQKYWKDYNYLIDYFFFHHFVSIISDFYQSEWDKIVPYPNSLPHVFLLRLFEKYNEEEWKSITDICPFHKLSYKRDKTDMEKQDTYYKHIVLLDV